MDSDFSKPKQSEGGWQVARGKPQRNKKQRPPAAAFPKNTGLDGKRVERKALTLNKAAQKAAYNKLRKTRKAAFEDEIPISFNYKQFQEEQKSKKKPKKIVQQKKNIDVLTKENMSRILRESSKNYATDVVRRTSVVCDFLSVELTQAQFAPQQPLTSATQLTRFLEGPISSFSDASLEPLFRHIANIKSVDDLVAATQELARQLIQTSKAKKLDRPTEVATQLVIQAIVQLHPEVVMPLFEQNFNLFVSLNDESFPLPVTKRGKKSIRPSEFADILSQRQDMIRAFTAAVSSPDDDDDDDANADSSDEAVVTDYYLYYSERLAIFIAGQLLHARKRAAKAATDENVSLNAQFPFITENPYFLPVFFRFFFPLCASPHTTTRLRLSAPLMYTFLDTALSSSLVPTHGCWQDACTALAGDAPSSAAAKTPVAPDAITQYYLRKGSPTKTSPVTFASAEEPESLDSQDPTRELMRLTMHILWLRIMQLNLPSSQASSSTTPTPSPEDSRLLFEQCTVTTFALLLSVVRQHLIESRGVTQRILLEWFFFFARNSLADAKSSNLSPTALIAHTPSGLATLAQMLESALDGKQITGTATDNTPLSLTLGADRQGFQKEAAMITLVWIFKFLVFKMKDMEENGEAEAEAFLNNNGSDWYAFARRMCHAVTRAARKTRKERRAQQQLEEEEEEEEDEKKVPMKARLRITRMEHEMRCARHAIAAAKKAMEATETRAIYTTRMAEEIKKAKAKGKGKEEETKTMPGNVYEYDAQWSEGESVDEWDTEVDDEDDDDLLTPHQPTRRHSKTRAATATHSTSHHGFCFRLFSLLVFLLNVSVMVLFMMAFVEEPAKTFTKANTLLPVAVQPYTVALVHKMNPVITFITTQKAIQTEKMNMRWQWFNETVESQTGTTRTVLDYGRTCLDTVISARRWCMSKYSIAVNKGVDKLVELKQRVVKKQPTTTSTSTTSTSQKQTPRTSTTTPKSSPAQDTAKQTPRQPGKMSPEERRQRVERYQREKRKYIDDYMKRTAEEEEDDGMCYKGQPCH